MFFKRNKDGLNGLDLAIQQAGEQLSRRRFLSGAAKWGAGIGLGLGLAATPQMAQAQCSLTRWVYSGCCGSGLQEQRKQTRSSCTASWVNTNETRCVTGPC
jgi:hypothetical protein